MMMLADFAYQHEAQAGPQGIKGEATSGPSLTCLHFVIV